ncbi:unnamed protein product [Spirodela intermedia]|uniref:C3H1-type domain-containing protein n=1 Tax=Spirodela intermedia TaxID=51605 RepID=A0A7I8J003_SPIIN|nr:unnamed protein product [Spirodela intermedia]CAA6663458.1 unnamed protein product [Spirodela intermedia]
MKNGNCKFGVACKFHHPQPAFTSAHEPAYPFYPSLLSPYQLSTMASWQGARTLPLSSGSYVPGPYGPVFIPTETIPVPGWGPYVLTQCASREPPTDEEGSLYGLSHQLSPSAPAYRRTYQPAPPFSSPPNNGQREQLLPERPDQPECQYYKKTGQCKFGSTCKFHHPPEKIIPKASYFLNPVGLPLRPGAPYCIFFAQHGVCKFGPSCKFDHPMGTLSYSPSTSSLVDMSVTPSLFSTGLRHGVSPNTAFSISTLSHSSMQAPLPPQISTPSSNSCNGPAGEGTTSGIETQ